MTLKAEKWIPIGAAASGTVIEAADGVVRAWSQHWFAAATLKASRTRAIDPKLKRPAADGWRVYGAAAALNIDRAKVRGLLSLLLDAALEQLPSSSADDDVLAALEKQVLEDLALRFDTAFGGQAQPSQSMNTLQDPFQPYGGIEVTISDGVDAELLNVALPLSRVAAVAAPLTPRARHTLTPIGEALGPTTVELEATVGTATLSFGELRGLGLGDVLVLNRALDQGVEVSVRGSARVLAEAELQEVDGRAALVF